MAAMSNYLENKLIDHLLRDQAFTKPANTYVSLHTASPADDASGAEVSGNNYARVAVAAALANWAGTQGAGTTVASSGTNGTTSNNGAITFPTPSGGWGVVTHFGVWDAATSGNLLFYGALSVSKTINADDEVSFAAGALTFQIDN